jgi:hypothetical protein
MARPKREDADLVEQAETEPLMRVKIKHYKIYTSQGRFIAGQFAELPRTEAEAIVAQGHAVAAV